MNRERLFELLSAAADDDLDTAERQELDTLLASSDEAQQLANQMQGMDEMLASLPDIEPPATLRDQIMQQVPMNQARQNAPRDSALGSWLRAFARGPVLGYVASTAIGALLVIAVYESQPDFGPNTDIAQLVGTMAPDTVIADRVILDRFSFDADGVSSAARLEKRGKAIVLDIRIDAERAVELAVDFGTTNLLIEALAQSNKEFDSIEFSDRVLRVKGRGPRRFSVLLRSADTSRVAGDTKILLEYLSDGSLLQQGALVTKK